VIREVPFRVAVALFFTLVFIALLVAAFCNDALSYDGAYYFFHLLDTRATLSPLGRIANAPLQYPTLVVSRYTDDLAILRFIFSACYASIPAIVLVLCWVICHKTRPSLFMWPALSICLAGLAGQFSFYAEAIVATNLLWPAILLPLTDITIYDFVLVAIAAVVAWFSYPATAVLLGAIAVVSLAFAATREEIRVRRFIYGIVFAGGALTRIAKPLKPYEQKMLGFGTLVYTFHSIVLGWPLFTIFLCLLIAIAGISSGGYRKGTSVVAGLLTLLVCVAGIGMVLWVIRSSNWVDSQGYRFWYPGIALLLMLGAATEVWLYPMANEGVAQLQRSQALVSMGAVFLVVLSLQSLIWNRLSDRLSVVIDESRGHCVEKPSITWLRGTALQHWSSNYYALDLQTRRPTALILDQNDCAILRETGNLRIVSWGPVQPSRDGWFDMHSLRRQLVAATVQNR
jgi:hypothetical protein